MGKKYCDIGQHECEALFHARKKDRPSACPIHAPRTPIKKSIVAKLVYQIDEMNLVAYKKQQTQKKDDVKALSALKKLAVIVFHRRIKKRDSHDNQFFCIACGKLKHISEAQSGHYMPGTYSVLKFEELNVNLECIDCNCHDPNHLIGYRKNLINKIGLAKVEWLESHKIAADYKWEREFLEGIISKYK